MKPIKRLFILATVFTVATTASVAAASPTQDFLVSGATSAAWQVTMHKLKQVSKDAWLPRGAECVNAETKPNTELKKAIIDYYQIPETEWSSTRYAYNYVDLNGDGTDEIFVVVMGPYTSGTGGDSALWVIPYANMAVNQTFTLVNTPIVVSDQKTNGANELIVHRAGGGAASEYVRLTCSDGTYTSVADAKAVADLSAVTGKAILCGDLFSSSPSLAD